MNEFLDLPVTHPDLGVTVCHKYANKANTSCLTVSRVLNDGTCGLEVRTSDWKSCSREPPASDSDALADFTLVI